MKNKILLITCSYDRTCDFFIKKYSDFSFFRYNTDMVDAYNLLITENDIIIEGAKHKIEIEKDCLSILYRKPAYQDLKGVISPAYWDFCNRENLTVAEGIAESFSGKCLSRPSVLKKANNKILQLSLAKKIGFILPRSVISNNYDSVEKILGQEKIVKPISCGQIVYSDKKEIFQTNIVDAETSSQNLKYCSSYFQDFINKDYDLRITFVNKKYWAVQIKSSNKTDWRALNSELSYKLISPPSAIINLCLEMLLALDLDFGCFDFVVKDDIYYFLEVNPNGQWLWLEQELGLNISGEIMDFLIS